MERLRLLVEGVNNKIRVLQRRAYGYRDEEYLEDVKKLVETVMSDSWSFPDSRT